MSVGLFLTAVGVFSLTLLARISGRVTGGQSPWHSQFALGGDFGDAMTHMLLAESIRRNESRILKHTPEFILSGPQDYPALFHWFLAFLPKHVLERFEWLISPSIEAIHASLVFAIFCIWLSEFSGETSLLLPSLMTGAWILNPGFAADVRRGAFLNERVFGFLFSDIYFLALAFWLIADHPGALICAVLAGCIVSVSSKFGMQAIVFITPLAALGLGDVRPVLPLALLLMLAPMLSGGYALFVWKGSLRHTAFYARYLLHVGDYVRSFSTRQYADAIRLLARGSFGSGLRLFLGHPFARVFLDSPAVWVALVAVPIGTEGTESVRVLIVLVLSAVAVAVVTSTDSFKYLGEGERYLEVAIAPALLLASIEAPNPVAWIFVLIVYSVFRSAFAWLSLLKSRRAIPSNDGGDTRALLDWLVKEPPYVIFSVPGRLAFPIAYAARQHRYVWWFINAPERDKQVDFERLFEGGGRYPYPTPRQAYATWNGVRADVAVLHRPTIAACRSAWGFGYEVIDGDVRFSNGTYVVVGLEGSDRQPCSSARNDLIKEMD